MILKYIAHRLKGFFAEFQRMRERQRHPGVYPVNCRKCGATMTVTEGFERYELEFHFDTEEHKMRSRENGF